MSLVEARLVSLLLNDSESISDLSLFDKYREVFDAGASQGELKTALRDLVSDEVVYEIDLDNDYLDLATVDHNELGILSQVDYSIEVGLNFYTPGAGFAGFINENKPRISTACQFGRLSNALTYLQGISYESSTWTGLPASFKLDPVRKEDLRLLLEEADRRLAMEPTGNGWEISQARSFIQSAVALTNAPQPPVDLIFANIERASAIAGLAQFFVGLITFFLGTSRA